MNVLTSWATSLISPLIKAWVKDVISTIYAFLNLWKISLIDQKSRRDLPVDREESNNWERRA